jgi:hypothetical protein
MCLPLTFTRLHIAMQVGDYSRIVAASWSFHRLGYSTGTEYSKGILSSYEDGDAWSKAVVLNGGPYDPPGDHAVFLRATGKSRKIGGP